MIPKDTNQTDNSKKADASAFLAVAKELLHAEVAPEDLIFGRGAAAMATAEATGK